MDWKMVGKSWKTTVGGVMLAVPPLLNAAGFMFSPENQHWLNLVMGVGGLLVGAAAKDASVHSTMTEVEDSTVKKAEGK